MTQQTFKPTQEEHEPSKLPEAVVTAETIQAPEEIPEPQKEEEVTSLELTPVSARH